MVRDEQATALVRKVGDVVAGDAEVTRVEEIDDGAQALLVHRVEAEVVDLLGAIAHADAAPLAQVVVGREELARGVEGTLLGNRAPRAAEVRDGGRGRRYVAGPARSRLVDHA